MMGADILFYPTAIGWEDHEDPESRRIQRDAWMCMQRSHAIANGIYVAAVNRVGDDGHGIAHSGHSMVLDPLGETIASESGKEAVITVTLEKQLLSDTREKLPFWRDADDFLIR